VPAGATLSAGIHNADGSWTLTPAQLTGLALTSDGEVQHFTLTVQATTVGGTTTDVSTATINVSVTPVADAPTLTIGGSGLTATVSGNEDTAIALPQITAALGEADADAVLSVKISNVPAGVTLSAGTHNADGSWTLTPGQLSNLTLTSDGETQHFNLTVTATTTDGGDAATAASTSGTLHINVAPVAETPTLDTIASPPSINEGATIALNLVPHFEVDPDAINTIVVSGLPSGATLNHGTLNPATGSYTLSQADLVGLTLTAPDDDTKQITFTVTAHASEGGIDAASASQQINLTVNPVAEAPTLTASAAATSVAEGGTVGLNIAVTPEVDADATTSVTISGLGTATLTDAAGDTFSGNTVTLTQAQLNGLTLHAADDDTASLHLTVTASTQEGGSSASSAAQQINLTVNPVAEAPTLTASAAATSVAEGGTVLQINAALGETDNDAILTVTLSGLPTSGVSLSDSNGDVLTIAPNGSITLTPAELAGLSLTTNGPEVVNLTVTATTVDGGDASTAASTSAALTVVSNLVAPVLTLQNGHVSGNEDRPIALGISAAPGEPDPGAVLEVTISGLPTSGVHLSDSNGDMLMIQPDGSIMLNTSELPGLTLTSDGEAQHFDLRLDVTELDNGFGASSPATTLHVDVTPVADAPTLTIGASGTSATVSGNEDKAIALPITAALGETDADAVLTVTITGVPSGATLSAGTLNANGSWTLTPAQLSGLTLTSDGEVQHFNLTVTATTVDGGDAATAASASGTFTVNVTPVADAPMLTIGASGSSTTVSGNEDQAIALPITAALGAADADAVLSVTITGVPAGVTLSAGTHNANGSWTLTPAQLAGLTLTGDGENQHFNLTVTATTVDGGDAATAASTSGSFTVNVTPVADAPMLTIGASGLSATVSGNEETAIALPIQAALGEVDADAVLSVSITGVPAGVTLSAGIHNADGSWTLTPAQLSGLTLTGDGEVQNFNLTVTATTVDGGDAATAASTSGTFAVNVTPVADLGFISPVLAVSADANGNHFGALLNSIGVDGNGAEVVFEAGAPATFDSQVWVKNLQTGSLTLESTDANGNAALHNATAATIVGASIDGAGDLVAFGSNATNLASNPTGAIEVFVKNIVTGQVTLASTNASGVLLAGVSVQPTISADGTTVTFLNGPSAAQSQLFQKNLATGALTLVSADAHGNVANAVVDNVPSAVSSNGNIVAFDTTATNLSASATDGKMEVFVKNLATGAVTLASADANGHEANAAASEEVISANGRFVAFASAATNLTANATSGREEVFVKDLQTGAVVLASADANGVAGTGFTNDTPSISADGRFVVFDTSSANLTGTTQTEIVKKDLLTGALTIVSTDANGNLGNGISNSAVISADGGVLVGSTHASNLGASPPSFPVQLFAKEQNVALGAAGKPIAIPLQFLEVDPDATSLILSGIPTGVTFSNTANTVPPIVNGSVTLTQAELAGLTLTSDGTVPVFNLVVSGIDGGVVSVSTTIEVEVAGGPAAATSSLHAAATPALGATSALGTTSVEAQFDAAHNVLNFNNHTVETGTAGQTIQLADAGHTGATLNAGGNQFIASGTNETLDLSGWDRAIEINFAAGTIRLDANTLAPSGSVSGFAHVLGTTHNDSFDNLAGGITVTGGAGAVDHFGLAANVLGSTNIPTITNYVSGETIDLSALLDAKFGRGSDPTKAASFVVEVKEDAGGHSATLEINVSGAHGGTFVAVVHLGGVHSGDVVTAILDHAHTTAQLHAA
jgi:large repetitive protein